MTTANPQPDFDNKILGPVLEALKQVLPGLEKLLEACHSMFITSVDYMVPLLCNSCKERNTCKGLCDKIQKVLPDGNPGRGRRENLTGLYLGTLKPTQKIWLMDIFDQYESCKEIFTPKQLEAISFYYGHGLTQEQVAKRLGKSRKAISGLLGRAKKRKEEYDRKLRAEKYKLINKKNNEE